MTQKAVQQLKLKGNSPSHGPTRGVNKELLKALGGAHKGIMEYTEQVGLVLINRQVRFKRGSTFYPIPHNRNLLKAKERL